MTHDARSAAGGNWGEQGFSLIETIVAVGVLSFGLLAAASLLSTGMQRLSGSPRDAIATAKASEAIESVFSARDTHTLTWAQIRNVSAGGIFLDGAQNLRTPGPDGLIDTADDGAIETETLPGPDQLFGTADDVLLPLEGFTRQIQIQDIGPNLRSITVTITYRSGADQRTYTLVAYISSFA